MRQTIGLPYEGATGKFNNMEIVSSGNSKKISDETRNNWVTMMFVTHNRYRCFKKKVYIDTCIQVFHDLERFGFEFGDFGFALNHVHFLVNIPKRYSIQTAEIMLTSYSAKKMFETFLRFRKRYSRGGFWNEYDYYESIGCKNLEESRAYIRDQPQHHNIPVIDDRQQCLPNLARRVRYGKTDCPKGGEFAEERMRNGIIRAEPLFHIGSPSFFLQSLSNITVSFELSI
ncbi:MAG: transposase [Euryarchaeota archaeon]|nr:transposase [Euryarchaeota archaeon]